MGRARRTKRGEEGRESRKRLEKERERDRQRGRGGRRKQKQQQLEKSESGKKWEVVNRALTGSQTAPQLQLPLPSGTRPPAPASTLLAGTPPEAAGSLLSRVNREEGKLAVGQNCLGHQGRRRHPHGPRPSSPTPPGGRRGRANPDHHQGLRKGADPLLFEPHSAFTEHLLSVRHRAPGSGDTDRWRTHLPTRSF